MGCPWVGTDRGRARGGPAPADPTAGDQPTSQRGHHLQGRLSPTWTPLASLVRAGLRGCTGARGTRTDGPREGADRSRPSQYDVRQMPPVRPVSFRLLGPLGASLGGDAVDLGSRKQRAVLAALLLERRRVVPLDRLVFLLWGD